MLVIWHFPEGNLYIRHLGGKFVHFVLSEVIMGIFGTLHVRTTTNPAFFGLLLGLWLVEPARGPSQVLKTDSKIVHYGCQKRSFLGFCVETGRETHASAVSAGQNGSGGQMVERRKKNQLFCFIWPVVPELRVLTWKMVRNVKSQTVI